MPAKTLLIKYMFTDHKGNAADDDEVDPCNDLHMMGA